MKKSAANEPASEDRFGQGFSRKLKHHAATPSADLWSRIELTLDKDEVIVHKKRWKLYSQLAAAVLALLMVTGGSFYYNNLNQPETAAVATGRTIQEKQLQVGPVKEPGEAVAQTENRELNSGPTETPSEALPAQANVKTQDEQAVEIAENSTLTENVYSNSVQPAKSNSKNLKPAIALNGKNENNKPVAVPETNTTTGIIAGNVSKSEAPANGGSSAIANESGEYTARTSVKNKPATTIITGAAIASVKEPVIAAGSAKIGSAVEHTGSGSGNAGNNTFAKAATGIQETGKAAIPAAGSQEDAFGSGSAKTNKAEMELVALRSSLPVNLPDTMKNALPVLAFMPDSGKFTPPATAISSLSKWSMGVSYTVQQFHQNVELAFSGNEGGTGKSPITTQDPAGLNAAQKEYNANTQSAYSWQGQMHAGYQLFPKWQLQTGILFTVNQAQTATSYLIKTPAAPNPGMAEQNVPEPLIVTTLDANAAQKEATISKVEKFNTVYRYQYIGLPVAIQFQPRISNKFQGFLSFGANVNRLIESSITSDKANIRNLEYGASAAGSPFRKWQVAVAGSAGFSFNITGNLKFLAGAEANYFVEPLVDQDKLPVRADLPYTIGFKTGLSFQFNKAQTSAK